MYKEIGCPEKVKGFKIKHVIFKLEKRCNIKLILRNEEKINTINLFNFRCSNFRFHLRAFIILCIKDFYLKISLFSLLFTKV